MQGVSCRSLALATVAGVLFSACAKSEGAGTDDTSTASTAVTASAASTLTVVATDFGYEAPDTISAGVITVRMANKGKEMHHVQILRLKDGKTYADLTTALQAMKPTDAPPAWIESLAGPTQGDSDGVIQEFTPGNYALLCLIPSPTDHVPHFAKGMMRSLTVIPATGPTAALPVSDISITMRDYTWDVVPVISAGKHVIRLVNAAAQGHETLFFRLAPGKTMSDMAKWAVSESGPPPGEAVGGTSGMDNGSVAFVPVNFAPGEYVMICFIPDAKGGKPHHLLGMMKAFTVS